MRAVEHRLPAPRDIAPARRVVPAHQAGMERARRGKARIRLRGARPVVRAGAAGSSIVILVSILSIPSI